MQAPEECPAEIEQLIDLCLATDPTDRPTAKQAFDVISACSPHLAAPSPPTPQQPIHLPAEPRLADSQASWQSAAAANLYNGQAPADHRSGAAGCQTPQQASTRGSAQETPSAWQPSQVDASLASRQMSTDQMQSAGSTADSQASDCQRTAQAVPSEQGDMRAQHQLPKQWTEGQDSSQHTWWPVEYGQERSPSTGQHASATPASGTLPLGAQGHLYPSPFAMAVDDSGPLWSWPDAAQNVA